MSHTVRNGVVFAVFAAGTTISAGCKPGCRDRIVVERRESTGPADDRWIPLKSAEYSVFTAAGFTGRKVSVSKEEFAHLEADEMVASGSRTFKACEGGGTLSIQDGNLVLLGMKEVDK